MKYISIWGCLWMIGLLVLSSCISINRPWKDVDELPLDQIKLPEGFSISLFASNVPNARSMTWGKKGTLFVSSRSAGNVYAIVDKDGDYRADKVYTIAKGLDTPNGVAFRDGSLFIAGVDRIWRMDQIEENLECPAEPTVLTTAFPDKTWHGWKYIAFGPDGKLYVPVGAPCNVCDEENPAFASIMRMNADGSELEVYASGIRNSVGFDWHPETSELWFTNNGRDMLGDDVPSDELNHAPKPGMHFGFPFCHQGDILDPKFGEGKSCNDYTAPVQKLGPHVAALGMKFYRGKMFPENYRSSVFIAEHGSWNRKDPIGYRLTHVPLNDAESEGYEIFAEGWLQDEIAWGRPVDVLEMKDGSMLVSDDHANVIYRISYNK